MKQGIPKSVQDLLARQTAADAHPSADLLNGYVERALTASEQAQVTNHLAACGECREIVFLASGVDQEESVPAVAAAMPDRKRQGGAVAEWRRPSWAWWKWAVPAVAVIAVAGGVFVDLNRAPERARPATETLAQNYPAASTVATNPEGAVFPNPPSAPATKPSHATPAASKKYSVAGADRKGEAARPAEQEQALQRSEELAESSPKKTRSSAVGGAMAAMPAAPRAMPALSLASGDVTGTVTDPSGAVVANATVTLKNSSTGQTRSTTTNNSGVYRFSLLRPGSYTVSATASGFSKAETTAMVNVGQATVGDVKMAVGANSQTVEITSAAPLVQADNADLSTNFNQGAVSNVPNGGNDLGYNAKTAPAPPSGGKDQSAPAASLKSGLMSSGQPGAANHLAKVEVARSRWRISVDGHLERALPGAAWTRVLADQPVTFRVVATVGANVWAGGNHGVLFHSADRGENWTPVALSAAGSPERGAVTSIHFDNALQGVVTADSGAIWSTSDGGQTWTKQ